LEDLLCVSPEVSQALADGAPVVALESAVITHGLPAPTNLAVARQMEEAVCAEGAVPATVAVLDGAVRVGLTAEETERLACHRSPAKVSLRDLPGVLAQGHTGGTTVAATIHLTHRCGIAVFATGGIGGVHRGHAEDISADLPALAATPVVVVCAGAKAILDLPRTLEVLETLAVPVVGYRTDTFPAFTSHSSGLPLAVRADGPEDVALMVGARRALGLRAAILVCVPVPIAEELPWSEAQRQIATGVAEADAGRVTGKDLTPFLLAWLAEHTEGRSLAANQALLLNNARVAAQIARALVTGGRL